MILKALCDYYDRRGDLPKHGTELKQIAFLIVIDKDGNFIRFEDRRDKEHKNGQDFIVPKSVGRTSAVKSNYLWDNGKYVLGLNDSDDRKCYEAFRQKIEGALEEMPNSVELNAVKCFYSKDYAELIGQMGNDSLWGEIEKNAAKNFSFLLNGDAEIVAEKSKLFLNDESSEKSADNEGVCLITGEKGELVEVASPTSLPGQIGGKLVAFQVNSGYDSYGKSQMFNSPISADAEFKYSMALNTMLASGSRNKFVVGERTFVFWASANNSQVEKEVESAVFSMFGFQEAKDDDPNERIDAARKVFESIYSGSLKTDVNDRFFILGVTPNSARIAVVYWNECPLKDFAKNIYAHFSDMEIVDTRKSKMPYCGLRTMVSAVTRGGKVSDAQPNLPEMIIKSIMQNTPYPYPLYRSCISRVRAEQDEDRQSVTIARAAILKAYLNRQRYNNNNINLKEMVDKENTNQGYLCGRLFAVLERIQESANGIQTIRTRYMNAASATPAAVFPTVMNLSVHHEEKLEKGRQIWFDGLKSEIIGKMESNGFPPHLSLQDQGRCFVGYYQQRQDFFTKKNTDEETTEVK